MTDAKPTGYSAGDPWWIKVLEYPLIALVLATLLALTAYALGYFLLSYGPELNGPMAAISEATMIIGLLWVVYKLVIRHMGDRPHDDLPAKGAVLLTAQGVGIGAAAMVAVVAIAALLGGYRIVGPGDARQFVLMLMLFAILPAFFEELLFRGIFFRWLEEWGGSWFALAITSGLFGFAHIMNPNATWWSSLAIALEAGVMLGGAYMATRSLWLPIGLHAAWNFTQGEIFDVPVSGIQASGLVEAELNGPDWLSGGTFGLEASVIALVVCVGIGVWFLKVAAQRGLIFRPIWTRDHALTFDAQSSIFQRKL